MAASTSEEVPPDLRRRARLVVAIALVGDIALVALAVGGRSERLGARAARPWLLATVILAGVLMLGVMRPLLRWEAERVVAAAAGSPAPAPAWKWALELAGITGAAVLFWRLFLDDSWRPPLARAGGIVAYFGVFVPLARLQRLGAAPYLRPAWYGFLLSGVTAGLVWAGLAAADLAGGAVQGSIFALMHYGYVRWAMRGVKAPAA